MRATLMYAAGDVRIEAVPDSAVKLPTDALVRITAAAICGSDLWPYAALKPQDDPQRVGHEFIGTVEEIGPEVSTVKPGDLVVSPFAVSDGTCEFCREGLQTSCVHPEAGGWDEQPAEGAQAEAIRVPLADGTLFRLPAAPDPALVPSLLALADVLGTGHHAAVAGGVSPRTRVTVIGDGAAPTRAYMAGLLPDILDGTTDPGRVFDATATLDGVPAGYRDMADRKTLKVLIRP
jgi:threonine dehydrogenase-like Zn-dependent dehydrogenase